MNIQKKMQKKTRKIVAIGGGEISEHETLLVDKRIIELTGKKKPSILFIPTAKSDDESYCQDFFNYFGKELDCKVSFLKLCSVPIPHKEIKEKIMGADAIYIGGGNTLKMMKLWRRLGVDTILKKAWESGIVLCGTSAGAICWFEGGHSDSMSFYDPKKWKYINVRGLGFLKGIMCPHCNSGTYGIPRERWFKDMMKKFSNTGIAIDECCAIEFIDDLYRVITPKIELGAYKVFKQKGAVVSKKIDNRSDFSQISELYK